ncbi:cytochrome P450 [Kribbella sp. NBC_00482]|uniref:cytochrome P450 n=1 Tax=Kribbella sp. NBC_00482 TaxID=2975968 RepID=UPI002E19638B
MSDPAFFASDAPVQVWHAMRRENPVLWVERHAQPGFWAVTGYRDAQSVLRRPDDFGSEGGLRLDTPAAAVRVASGRMLIATDPPRHTHLRRSIGAGFRTQIIRELEIKTRGMAEALIGNALLAGGCDFVSDIAGPLSTSVVCELMGIPPADQPLMGQLADRAFGASRRTVDSSADERDRMAAHADILLYYWQAMERKRYANDQGLITRLVQSPVGGSRLTDEEVVLNCDGLLAGGNETARLAAATGLQALIEDPRQWARLCRTPTSIPGAVEEILRWTSPASHVLRVARQDTELGGNQVAAGDLVAVWLPAANRDPEVFVDPDTFDTTRIRNRHIAFGSGDHSCIGSAIARMELRVLFEELSRRVARFEITGPLERLRSNTFWGVKSMSITVTETSAPTARMGIS